MSDLIDALCRSIEPAGGIRVARRMLLIVASDRDRVGLAHEPATWTAAASIFDGTAAVAHAARAGDASVVVIDAGCARALPSPAIALPGTLDAGAAVVVSIAEATGLDLMTGAIVAAASLHARVVLDGDATGAAALAAVARQPAVRGYLVAPHSNNKHLGALGLTPVFQVGLGHGEGAGAAMVLPFVDQLVAGGKPST